MVHRRTSQTGRREDRIAEKWGGSPSRGRERCGEPHRFLAQGSPRERFDHRSAFPAARLAIRPAAAARVGAPNRSGAVRLSPHLSALALPLLAGDFRAKLSRLAGSRAVLPAGSHWSPVPLMSSSHASKTQAPKILPDDSEDDRPELHDRRRARRVPGPRLERETAATIPTVPQSTAWLRAQDPVFTAELAQLFAFVARHALGPLPDPARERPGQQPRLRAI
jgi:hypothetical protein